MCWNRQGARFRRRINGGEAMASLKPAKCPSMDEVRREIDRIDEALVDLIAERFGYVDRAWQLKQSAEEALVPWRVEEVVAKVRERAENADLPPDLAEELWRQMISWFIRYEEANLLQVKGGVGQVQHGR